MKTSDSDQEWILKEHFTFENGGDVDRSIWTSPKWISPNNNPSFFGRTSIRNIPDFGKPLGCIPVINKAAQLRLSTYNPKSNPPDTSFLGSQIETIKKWGLKNYKSVAFEANVLCPSDMPSGAVTSLFSYNLLSRKPFQHDEIDFEFASKHWSGSSEAINTNVYVDSNDGIVKVVPNGVDFSKPITFKIEWSSTYIKWFINGELIRTERSVPQSDMSLVFNFWAPASSWGWAYDQSFNPSSAPGDEWVYQVNWAKVLVKK